MRINSVTAILIYVEEERWLNGSAPDCQSVVLGLHPAPPQHMANSCSPEVGSHLGLHRTVCWPLRGGRGTQYTQKPLKINRKKISIMVNTVHQEQNTLSLTRT
jgi:hypothetical protein